MGSPHSHSPNIAQSAVAVEYIDCNSAEGVLDMTLNNLMVNFQ